MKIISLDCETDGLYGPIIAIGAVLWENGQTVGFGRRVSWEPDSAWVLENVWPQCKDLPQTISPLGAFASWWAANKRDALVIADVGVPVEARLFRDMVAGSFMGEFDGPYPLHEVATLLLAAGVDPDIDRETYAFDGGVPDVSIVGDPHNPVFDARVSLACWLKASVVLEENQLLRHAAEVEHQSRLRASIDPEGEPRPGSMD